MLREDREFAIERQTGHTKDSNPMLPINLGGLQMHLQGAVKSMAVPWPDLSGCCWLIKYIKPGRKRQPPPSQPLTGLYMHKTRR